MGPITLNVAIHLTRGYMAIQKSYIYKNDLDFVTPSASSILVTAPESPSVKPCK